MLRALLVCLVWCLNVLVKNEAISRGGGGGGGGARLTPDNFTHETEWGDRDFRRSRAHYTDINPINRE